MDPVFKAWRVTAVVSVLQLLLGIVLYQTLGDIPHTTFLVGFGTMIAVLPIVEGEMHYCQRMESIILTATFAAFAITTATDVPIYYERAGGYLGWDFFMVAFLIFITILLVGVALAFVLLIALHYQGMDEVQERPRVTIACLLPAGLGLVFGGAVLLYRKWQNFREMAGWV
jgi:hypothetical protein